MKGIADDKLQYIQHTTRIVVLTENAPLHKVFRGFLHVELY
jgi:hypothetical protein